MRPQYAAAVTEGEHKTCVRTCQRGDWRCVAASTSERGIQERSAGDRVPPRAARTNAATRPGSLRPGDDSTPLATSTIHGRTWPIRSATFSGVRPPARIRWGRGGGLGGARRRSRARSLRAGRRHRHRPARRRGDGPVLGPAQVPHHARDRLGVPEAERADDPEMSEGDEVGRRLARRATGRSASPMRSARAATSSGGRSTKRPTARARGGQGGDDLRGEGGLDPTGRGRVEVQADPVGTGRDTGQGVGRRWSGRRP